MSVRILVGGCMERLQEIPDGSVHCCVTSPPYWGLRDYQEDDQLGLEPTPEEYVANMVGVFREVRRVLRNDGTLWLNLGDSYNGVGRGTKANGLQVAARATVQRTVTDLKSKDLVGIPWRVAFALQANGWWLRQDIIWQKPNPMPESVRDRCTKAHEYIFLLSKSARYFYDMEAIREPTNPNNTGNIRAPTLGAHRPKDPRQMAERVYTEIKGANRRSVWSITTKPFSEAHFATFPTELPELCIKAGCPEGGTVLDPFGGAGTTGLVADRLKRDAILIELNPEYAKMAERRIYNDAPMFANVSVEEAA